MCRLFDKRVRGVVVCAVLAQSTLALLSIPALLGFAADKRGLFDDIFIYHRYADRFLAGELPYRDYRIEYPPLAVPVMVAPRLLGAGVAAYTFAFAFEMLLANAVIVILIAHSVIRSEGVAAVSGRLWWYTSCFVALCPLAVARYDLVPALLSTSAIIVWPKRRRVMAGVLAGIGVLVKLFPGLVFGFGFLLEARDRRWGAFRGTAAFLATVATGVTLWFAVGGLSGVANSVGFQTERGIEVESLYSGALMIAANTGFTTGLVTLDETIWHLSTPWSSHLKNVSVFVQLTALMMVFWYFHRNGAKDVERYSAAALVAVVITGKVLSPQYMLWILPAVSLVGGRVGSYARRIFLPCCLATSLVFPWLFDRLLRWDRLALSVLNARNLLLVCLLLVLLYHRQEGAPSSSGS
jgi:hypothetical protein